MFFILLYFVSAAIVIYIGYLFAMDHRDDQGYLTIADMFFIGTITLLLASAPGLNICVAIIGILVWTGHRASIRDEEPWYEKKLFVKNDYKDE